MFTSWGVLVNRSAELDKELHKAVVKVVKSVIKFSVFNYYDDWVCRVIKNILICLNML